MLQVTGEGSVRKNGSTWQAVFSFRDDATGERVQRTYPTGVACSASGNRGRNAAMMRKAEIREELLLKEASERRGGTAGLIPSIRELIDFRYKTGAIAYQTVQGYNTSLKHIERGFRDCSVADVTSRQIQEWISTSIDEGHSPNTMAKAYRLLNLFYNAEMAHEGGRVNRNPCQGVKVAKPRGAKPNPLTRSNLEVYNKALSNMGDCVLKRASTIALNCGMRVGECSALKWGLVDFKTRAVNVYFNATPSENGLKLKDNKGHERRQAPMDVVLYCYLKDLRRKQVKALEKAGIKNAEVYLDNCFVVSGTPELINPQNISKKYSAAAQALNLVGIDGTVTTFHGLRHTFATQWIAAGGDVKALSDILGHKDASMTLNVYTGCDDLSRRQGIALAAPELTRGYELGSMPDSVREYYADCDELYSVKVPARLWYELGGIAAREGISIDEACARAIEVALAPARGDEGAKVLQIARTA